MLLSANISGLFIVIGSASFLLLLIFFFLLFIQYSRKRLIHVKEMFALQQKFDSALMQSQIEIQEQTFTYISDEIHDNIGQMLSLVRINVSSLPQNDTHDTIEMIDELLERSINDLRNLSHSLNTNYIKEVGLVEGLRKQLSVLEKTGRFQCNFVNQIPDFSIPENNLIILFRMIQEILNNIVKHASAQVINVRFEGDHDLEQIIISDDGRGFDHASVQTIEGLGMRNIVSRGRMIGAYVHVKSSPGLGTSIAIDFKKQI
jgi:signal transduction histidine kinase